MCLRDKTGPPSAMPGMYTNKISGEERRGDGTGCLREATTPNRARINHKTRLNIGAARSSKEGHVAPLRGFLPNVHLSAPTSHNLGRPVTYQVKRTPCKAFFHEKQAGLRREITQTPVNKIDGVRHPEIEDTLKLSDYLVFFKQTRVVTLLLFLLQLSVLHCLLQKEMTSSAHC